MGLQLRALCPEAALRRRSAQGLARRTGCLHAAEAPRRLGQRWRGEPRRLGQRWRVEPHRRGRHQPVGGPHRQKHFRLEGGLRMREPGQWRVELRMLRLDVQHAGAQ